MAASAPKTKSAPIQLLTGSDEDAVKRAAAELAAKLAPEDPMNFETIDGLAQCRLRDMYRRCRGMHRLAFHAGDEITKQPKVHGSFPFVTTSNATVLLIAP